MLDKSFGVKTADISKATHGFELGTVDDFTKFAGYTVAQEGFSAVANTAINGGSLKDNLAQVAISSAADVLTAGIYNKLGSQLEFSGLPAKVGAHALVGGLIAELAGGDFRVGALAAGANEAFVASVGDKIFAENSRDQLLAMTSQLIGLTVAAAAGGSDKDQAVASWVAMQATKYNSLDHPTAERLLDELKACRANRCSEDQQRSLIARYEKISADRSALLAACPTAECREAIRANTIALDDPVAQELVAWYRQRVSYDMVGLLTGDPSQIAMPAQGYDPWGATYVTDDQIILALNIQQNALTPAQQAYLETWNKETDWMDLAAGRVLTVAEKAEKIVALGNAMLTEGWGKASSGNSASGNGTVQGGSGAGAKATATPRTPLAGPTENWKTFVNAEKQIQLEAGAGQRVDQVINETLSGKKNFTSSMTLTTDEALSAGQKYLGPEYREIGKPGSGVFHSADGTKEFRIDSGSISGAHAPGVPHVHFGVKDPVTGKYISNNYVPYAD
ncbi:DUF637 domain-containing protein [Pseudomonas caspiana]|uniref:DUF637 domain-containing protein n=1 Tax=Pseudomonas caspiana TaxID=1451454 RepID=A0A1Y3NWE7_9PSED|nr:DUF637 domain-containing protein [Pseudomonas caspiana]OUM71919.1 hypothetical protein AUC60_20670 [Pseudomonas caspiana]